VSLVVVPHYLDANENTTRLAGKLLEAEEIPGELASVEELLKEEQKRAEQLASSLVPAEKSHDFHNRVVGLARKSGCKVRRLTEGTRSSQPWTPGQPIVRTAGGPPTRSAPSEDGFQLETQELKLELTGTLAQLKKFLEDFKATETYVHTRTFSLSQPRGQQVTLEMSVIILNLTKAKAEQNA
jgi:hypothetical protein